MENTTFQIQNGRHSVPAVTKAIRVLSETAAANAPLGISELARRTGSSKSTVHSIVATLVGEGFLTPSGNGYRLGREVIRLGAQARGQQILEAAEEALERMPLSSGETVLFGRLEGEHVVIDLRRSSGGPLNLSAPLGSRVPVMAGALGKAFLGHLAAADSPEEEPFHQSKVPTAAAVPKRSNEGDVESARHPGFATERSEYLPGVAAAASAFELLGDIYLLWIVGIDANYDDGQLEQAGKLVRDTAADLVVEFEPTSEEATAS